ncbi:SAM-dependent methyltransferase [Microlunatus soli]|uniref:Methyltransferase domain-containing protein n=1 Tax=Microlunatus soli TaxID=630515 RepID=A0A1H1VQ01_9ACTN|nr:class I SAM-dependent methyltransferase [Microlunatus soli]SDS87014.1 Methyltransferase domain-containing protein [Microlunatus soli]
MTDTVPINGLALTVNSPISGPRLDRLVTELATGEPTDILDVGCGWAELLLRVLAASPDAVGTGIDLETVDVERGRSAAVARGLDDRVRLIAGDAKTITGAYDLVLCLGAHHALDEDPGRALTRLRRLTADGGRLLFGIDYWLHTPPPERLATMWGGADLQDSCWLPDVVDAAAAAGWRLLDLQETTQQEWDDYECGLVRNQEEWLLQHPDHPDADELRQRLDRSRSEWLRGHHGYLGFACLTLAAMPGG